MLFPNRTWYRRYLQGWGGYGMNTRNLYRRQKGHREIYRRDGKVLVYWYP